jgi:hypothetical protein
VGRTSFDAFPVDGHKGANGSHDESWAKRPAVEETIESVVMKIQVISDHDSNDAKETDDEYKIENQVDGFPMSEAWFRRFERFHGNFFVAQPSWGSGYESVSPCPIGSLIFVQFIPLVSDDAHDILKGCLWTK